MIKSKILLIDDEETDRAPVADQLRRALDKAKISDEMILEQAALINQARDAILLLSLDGEILIWNRGAERLYGWTAAEVIGCKDTDFFSRDIDCHEKTTKELFRDGYWEGELTQRTCSGAEVVVESRLSLTRDAGGAAKSILVIATDITEKKKNQEHLLRSQRLESIGTLSGGIAHDLNNLLTPIMMSIELLQMGETNPRRLRTLNTIANCAGRGAAMIKQILSFARGFEGAHADLRPVQILGDLEKIIENTFLKTIKVNMSIAPDILDISGDATQLNQVLLNLCVNAKDAMPDGGTLSLSAENIVLDEREAAHLGCAAGSYVRIGVEDSGTGMPKAVLDRVFEPFFTTKELGKGTGLGLSTSTAIVKSHNGFIRAYSEEGVGTKFNIYLPAKNLQASDGVAPVIRHLPRGSGECILVVDDEPAVRQITQQILEAFGYQVRLASGGAEAVAIYQQDKKEIALVLTDMMMPNQDGFSTIKELRKIKSDVMIIAASGLTSNENTAFADSFLPKPYTAEALLKTIKVCLTGQ